MQVSPSIEDLIGIEYIKLGYYKELQDKIAELEAINAQLEVKQQHIQSILEGITDVMAIISLDLRITSVNRFYFEIFEDKNPIGKFCYKVFRQREDICPDCPIFTAIQVNQVQRQVAMIPIAGKIHHFEITASPLRNSAGYPYSILLLKRDVTLEKEYQAKFYQAEKMSTIGMLAAGIAHEINNPLTAISGFAQGLKRRLTSMKKDLDKTLSKEFEEYLTIILKECKRCKEIVQNLLDLGRPKQQKFSPLDLNQIIIDTIQLIRSQARKKRQNFIILKLSKLSPLIYGDLSQLKQVFLNLLLNSIDAIENKGTITITTSIKENRWVEVSIIDTGKGIDPDHMDKLFEPFFTTKPPGKGTGIGLSTCYNIVKNHGGEISVVSELGKGSTFTVRLPINAFIPLETVEFYQDDIR